MRFLLGGWLVLAMFTCSAVPAVAQQDKVGVVAMVSPKATGQAPHRSIKPLVIGNAVVRKEKLSTFDKGKVQLLLIDQSTITMAENSQIIIDDFVLDAETGASRITATIYSGLVRYSGRRNPKASAEFLTPSGVVTLQGGGGAVITAEPSSISGPGQ